MLCLKKRQCFGQKVGHLPASADRKDFIPVRHASRDSLIELNFLVFRNVIELCDFHRLLMFGFIWTCPALAAARQF